MNLRTTVGFVLAFAIGITCRLVAIPLPAPPALLGALVVLAMTLGYLFADRYISQREATQRRNCGGPEG